ncbi:hypothetical protein [Solidesulfovibrio sp.]
MNGPASSPRTTAARQPLAGRITRLARFDERELAGPGTRFWELTLHKTDTGGYVLESFLRSERDGFRPMAAALAFADAGALLDYLETPHSPSPLAEGLLARAAVRDPDLAPGRMP